MSESTKIRSRSIPIAPLKLRWQSSEPVTQMSWVRIPPKPLCFFFSGQNFTVYFSLGSSSGTKMSESTGIHSRAVPIMAL